MGQKIKIVGAAVKGIFLCGVMALLTSCQATEVNITKEDIHAVDKSQAAPKANITRYSSALKQFGKMLAAYNCDYLRVQSKPITDATAAGGVPKNLQQMVISSLNKIGSRLKYVDYDFEYVLRQDALENRKDPNRKANIQLEAPNVLVSGAITEYDKGLINKAKSMNADISGSVTGNEFEAGFGADNDAGVSRIAVDFQLIDYTTQQLVPGAMTALSVNVSKTSSEKEMGFAIFGTGFGISGSIQQKQGLHSAIRLLVEMSVLELMGEYYTVPYWRVVEGAEPNQDVIAKYREMIEEDDNNAFTTRLKVLAFTHGYDMNLMDISLNEHEMGIYQGLKQKFGTNDDYDLLTKLWLNVPIKEGAKRLKMAKRSMQQQAAAPPPQAPASPPQPVAPQAQRQAASTPPPVQTNSQPAATKPAAKKKQGGVVLFGSMSDDEFDSDDF